VLAVLRGLQVHNDAAAAPFSFFFFIDGEH
jgi:hypothetical protein